MRFKHEYLSHTAEEQGHVNFQAYICFFFWTGSSLLRSNGVSVDIEVEPVGKQQVGMRLHPTTGIFSGSLSGK